MRYCTVLLLMFAQVCFSQTNQQLTTVLFSSVATPQSIAQLVEELPDRGIELYMDRIKWNEDQSRIEEVELSVQFQKNDGTLSAPTHHSFKYNILNEGTILLLQNGEKYTLQILAHNQNLLVNQSAYTDLPNMVFGAEPHQNMVYSSFSQPFKASNTDQKNVALNLLSDELQANNELIATIMKERDPGHRSYTYRYYYNGSRLYGTLGINDQDMICRAIIKNDADGIPSLFVDSNVELSIHAATYDQ